MNALRSEICLRVWIKLDCLHRLVAFRFLSGLIAACMIVAAIDVQNCVQRKGRVRSVGKRFKDHEIVVAFDVVILDHGQDLHLAFWREFVKNILEIFGFIFAWFFALYIVQFIYIFFVFVFGFFPVIN